MSKNINFKKNKGGIDEDLSGYVYSDDVKEYIIDSCIDSFALYEYYKKFNKILGNSVPIYLKALYGMNRSVVGLIICAPVNSMVDMYHFRELKDWYDIHSNNETDIALMTIDEYYMSHNKFQYDDDYED